MGELRVITFSAMVLDVATGFAGAIKCGSVQSGRMREGLWHKAGFVGMIAMAYLLEFGAHVADLGVQVPAVSAVCVFVVLTETASILENLCVLNPAIAASPLGSVFGRDGEGGMQRAADEGGLLREVGDAGGLREADDKGALRGTDDGGGKSHG